jgi:site-specific DNA recombinase
MHVALYARVSTGRQEREQTIASQLSALRIWVVEQGHEVLPDHIYCDEGWSGARLDRPALDRLRDAARATGLDDREIDKTFRSALRRRGEA